jgi:AraC-like DNA-binding protein
VDVALNRIDDLRELVSQRLLNLDFQKIDDSPFQSSIRSVVRSPDLHAVRWTHSPGLTFRDHRLVKDGDESMSLIYPVNCTITVTHLDREQRLTPGHSMLLRHDAVGSIGAHQACRFVALVIAPTTLEKGGLLDRGLLAESWPDQIPALRLLKAYMSVLAAARVQRPPDRLEEAAGRHIIELIQLAVSQMSDRPIRVDTEAIAHARLAVVLAFLRREFRQPGLNVTVTAAAHNLSPRYLHRLMERANIRFTAYVNELRLNAAHAALQDTRRLSVSAIALDVGFSDLAHFNRLFKKRFGVTPSDVRARKAADG